MFDWLRRMLGPCECCEVLKESLAIERSLNKDLMKRLLPDTNPHTSARPDELIAEPKQPFIPWRVKRQMLEEQDRKKAQLMKEFENTRPPTTDELEKEIGIETAT